MDAVQELNAHFLAQQQALLEAQKRLDKIETNIEGIPQEILFIKDNINRMCVSMDKLLERLETKYVPRELFDNTILTVKDHVKVMNDTFDTQIKVRDDRIAKIEDQNKWLVRGMVASLLYVLKDLVLPFFIKH